MLTKCFRCCIWQHNINGFGNRLSAVFQLSWHNPLQPRGLIVRWLLEELNVPYQIKVLQYGPEMKSADFLALQPMGKVPVITHGDLVVSEAAAICAYLADHFADKQLAPAANSPERGTYYRWLFFAVGSLEMATSAKAFNWRLDADNAATVGCGLYLDTLDAIRKSSALGTIFARSWLAARAICRLAQPQA